ncbi:MFS transporter [Salinactinospora qingdaonensis]|uniref:MFS transporter n=1 Tax=Salinactinospora qingdaonensis TaxID=702744 RepID=A0ABP7G1G6_9ACTN
MTTQSGAPDAASQVPGSRPGGLLLLGLSLGYFMVMLDTTVVTVALPAIGDTFSGSLSFLQWVSNGYTVAFAALLLSAGVLADRYGARRVFMIGLVAFGLLSGLSALVASVEALIVLRVMLGVAGALLLPASLAVIAHAFSDPGARAKAMGAWAAISGTALAAGPTIGGVLTDALGWRSIFLVNVPVALVSLLITRSYAPKSPRKPGKGIDLPGQVSIVVALTSLTYGLIESEPLGWTSPQVVGALLVFVVAIAAFVTVETSKGNKGDEPMLPMRIFTNRIFSAGLFAGMLVNFALSGLLFVLALFFQESREYSAFMAGVAFIPLTLPPAFNPIFTGRLVARVGPKVPSVIGFVMMAVGAFLQVPFSGNSGVDIAATVVGLLVVGFGISFAIPALMTGVVGSVPPEQSGLASGALNSSRQTGAVLGVAILGTIMGAASSIAAGTQIALVVAGSLLLVGAAIVGIFVRKPEKAQLQ